MSATLEDPRLESFRTPIVADSPKTPRVIRAYSPSERAQALAIYDNVGTLEKASEVAGIPLSTLAGWVNDPANHSELRNKKSIELGQKFENAANLFIDLAVKKAKKASFNHLVTGAGIAFDKMQVSRGLPTSISGSVMSDDERKLRLAELVAKVSERQGPAESPSSPGMKELHGPGDKVIESAS